MRIFRYFSKNLLFRPLNLHFRPWSRKQKFLRIKFYLRKQSGHSMIRLLEPSRVSQAIQNSVQIIIKVIFRLRESPYLWPGWMESKYFCVRHQANNMTFPVGEKYLPYCQALVPNPLSPNPLGPALTQSNPVQRPKQVQGDWG